MEKQKKSKKVEIDLTNEEVAPVQQTPPQAIFASVPEKIEISMSRESSGEINMA